MADKKIPQLNPAAALGPNDLFVVSQNISTGEAVYIAAADVRTYMLGGPTSGARIYFAVGVPDPSLGVDGDVYYDQNARIIYQKSGSGWVAKGSYGGISDYIRFSATYGSGGLAADGKSYTNAAFVLATIISVKVEADELIPVQTIGNTPLFDEYNFDDSIGKLFFGAALPAGLRITITYSK